MITEKLMMPTDYPMPPVTPTGHWELNKITGAGKIWVGPGLTNLSPYVLV